MAKKKEQWTLFGVPMTAEQIKACKRARQQGDRRVRLESTPEQNIAWKNAVALEAPEKQRIIDEYRNRPDYARSIACRRRKLGLTLDELAEQTGISKANLSRLETGFTKNPTLETLRRVGEALGLVLLVDFAVG